VLAPRPVPSPLAAAAAAVLAAVAGGAPARAGGAPDGGAPPGTLVDAVVAVVRPPGGEARAVTLSKVAEEGRIALVSRGGIEAAVRPLDAMAMRASLDWYIDQVLLYEEAVRLKVFEVDRSDALASLARFKEVFARADDYRAFLYDLDITEEELLGTLRRMLRVRRYLESRLGRIRVSDAEAEAWYRGHAPAYGGAPFAEVRDLVKARMADDRVDAETRSLLADLHARSEIRVLYDFSRGG